MLSEKPWGCWGRGCGLPWPLRGPSTAPRTPDNPIFLHHPRPAQHSPVRPRGDRPPGKDPNIPGLGQGSPPVPVHAGRVHWLARIQAQAELRGEASRGVWRPRGRLGCVAPQAQPSQQAGTIPPGGPHGPQP